MDRFSAHGHTKDKKQSSCKDCADAYAKACFLKHRKAEGPEWVLQLLNGRSGSRRGNVKYHPGRLAMRALAIQLHQDLQTSPICPYTKEPLVIGVNLHLDHIRPVSRYPNLAYKYSNLQWVSKRYNTAKGAMTHEELIDFCRILLSQ
jgi:5-methylcytosine-specific restriction endonuclease McrA